MLKLKIGLSENKTEVTIHVDKFKETEEKIKSCIEVIYRGQTDDRVRVVF